MQTANGRDLPASVALVKRSVDRAQNKIEEIVISLRGVAPAQEFLTVITPEGSKAKISCSNCEIEGEGELIGEPWEWTGFKFKSRIGKTGPLLEGEDKFSPDGMTAEKRMPGSDGRPGVVIRETGRHITQATYDNLRVRLLSK